MSNFSSISENPILFHIELMHYTTKFSKITLSFIFVSQKFKLKLISEKLLLSMILRNKVSITVSTLRFNITRDGFASTLSNPMPSLIKWKRNTSNFGCFEDTINLCSAYSGLDLCN